MTLPQHAMVLAAGKGMRMRPLTLDRPKALVKVGGTALIDWALDMLGEAGVGAAVVNHHHYGKRLATYLGSRPAPPAIALSDETAELLETGGGVAKALPLLGEDPFFVINADGVWIDGAESLKRLAHFWKPSDMDALLLLASPDRASGFDGTGDFFMDDDHRLRRRGAAATAPFIYCGIQLISPALFAECPEGPFSTNILWDRALAQGRLFGLEHPGHWLHVGTPQGRDDAETILRQS